MRMMNLGCVVCWCYLVGWGTAKDAEIPPEPTAEDLGGIEYKKKF
jgi:hypothetical protein